jgi:hypothetical protein
MSDRVFRDRRDAGRVLARLLEQSRGQPDVVVLALRGTHEFYEARAAMSRRLIQENGRAVELKRTGGWERGEVPETNPFAA